MWVKCPIIPQKYLITRTRYTLLPVLPFFYTFFSSKCPRLSHLFWSSMSQTLTLFWSSVAFPLMLFWSHICLPFLHIGQYFSHCFGPVLVLPLTLSKLLCLLSGLQSISLCVLFSHSLSLTLTPSLSLSLSPCRPAVEWNSGTRDGLSWLTDACSTTKVGYCHGIAFFL